MLKYRAACARLSMDSLNKNWTGCLVASTQTSFLGVCFYEVLQDLDAFIAPIWSGSS